MISMKWLPHKGLNNIILASLLIPLNLLVCLPLAYADFPHYQCTVYRVGHGSFFDFRLSNSLEVLMIREKNYHESYVRGESLFSGIRKLKQEMQTCCHKIVLTLCMAFR